MALAREMRPEYLAIHEAGLILQIDAPDLAMERTMTFQDQSEAEFVKTCELHMAALNKAIEGIPRDRVRLHCCWGNWEGPHVHDIALAPSCRCSTRPTPARSPSSSPIRATSTSTRRCAPTRCPKDWLLIPGVIDTTTNFVEHPQVVARRIEEAVSVGRRPRARDRLHRLRLRHLRGPRVGGCAHRLEEAQGAARRRRHRLRQAVGPGLTPSPAPREQSGERLGVADYFAFS